MTQQLDPQGIEVRTLLEAVTFDHARVLEVGCGDGRLTFRYGNRPRQVVGIEPQTELLVAARSACPPELRQQLSFVQATAMKLPFPDSAFDIALLAKSL